MTPWQRHTRRHRARAFTLVEVAVVVVIVGVLAVIGVVSYSRYKAAARISEATSVSSDIRKAQEAFKAEHGVYHNVSLTKDSLYPATTPGKFVTQWGGPCAGCNKEDSWKSLNVAPSAPVMYGYATLGAVGSGSTRSSNSTGKNSALGGDETPIGVPPPIPVREDEPWYITVAKGDTDGDGKFSRIVGYSMTSSFAIEPE